MPATRSRRVFAMAACIIAASICVSSAHFQGGKVQLGFAAPHGPGLMTGVMRSKGIDGNIGPKHSLLLGRLGVREACAGGARRMMCQEESTGKAGSGAKAYDWAALGSTLKTTERRGREEQPSGGGSSAGGWREQDQSLVARLQREMADLDEILAARSIPELEQRRRETMRHIKRLEHRIATSLISPPPPPAKSPPTARKSPVEEVLSLLEAQGLKVVPVPPHKDSYFLALVKSLDGAGIRPKGFEPEEDADGMRGAGGYRGPARRAKYEILRLLSAGAAGRLNNKIGGWPLSPAEFGRYFSNAWWSLPAARSDLFTATAEFFSISVEVISVTDSGIEREVYHPPEGEDASKGKVVLCRKSSHVIATKPLMRRSASGSMVRSTSPPRSEIPLADVDAGLFGDDTEGDDSQYLDASDSDGGEGDSDEDDELMSGEGESRSGRKALYGEEVATCRLFVVIMLDDESREVVCKRVEDMRASFPLEGRRLDRILRWTRPESMHMTVHTLDAIEDEVEDVAGQLENAIRDAYVLPFSVRTGPVGCFWAAAGSGFGRIPRVVYQGVHEEDLRPLLRLHKSLGDADIVPAAKGPPRPFCAHITVAKTTRREELNANDRRALRVFGKWIQDPDRPMELQKALQPRLAAPPEGSRRGYRRFRNWFGSNKDDIFDTSTKRRRLLQRYLDWDGVEEDGRQASKRGMIPWQEPPGPDMDDDDDDLGMGMGMGFGEGMGSGGGEVRVEKLCVVRSRKRTDGWGVRYEVLREVTLGVE